MPPTRTLYSSRIIFLVVILLSFQSHMKAQTTPAGFLPPEIKHYHVLSGYSRDISGEVLEYHSCHPDANASLLIRCLNHKDKIEWLTDSLPVGQLPDTLVFGWIGEYSVGTSRGVRQFHVFLEGVNRLSFTTRPDMGEKDWTVMGSDGVALVFRFGGLDIVKDHFGYMFLKVPSKLVSGKSSLRIKITGDASGSRDWYMTMRYNFRPKVKIEAEAAVYKGAGGKVFQRVKVSMDHFEKPVPVVIKSDGKVVLDSQLSFGLTYFYLKIDAVKQKISRVLEVTSQGHTEKLKYELNPVRDLTVYLLPHSHVDIGYTALQTEVEQTQVNNIDLGIELARKTADYPDGARFRWNPEVLWPVDAYLRRADEQKKNAFIEAVQKGWIGLDGTYANELTALCRPEELYRMFDFHNKLQDLTGVKIETAMITDVPGYTWGMVPAMAQNGIRYFSVGANNGDRIGHVLDAWGDKPFWWVSASGKEKILMWLAGTGYAMFHRDFLSKGDGSKVLEYLASLSADNYPYDMVQVRYTTGGDNGYPDKDLPDFVKNWNEKYLTPRFRIATTKELFDDFVKKYGDKIPEVKGDFTPYWEDGAASSAKETAMNRVSADRLVQAEILFSLLTPSTYPWKEVDEAWRQVVLYSEHTWGAWNSISEPDLPFVTGQWKLKQDMALAADSLSNDLFNKALYSFTNSKSNGKVLHFRVFNSNSWKRSGLVKLPAGWIIDEFKGVCDETGTILPLQHLGTGEWGFVAVDIPPLGASVYKFVKEIKPGEKKEALSYVATDGEVVMKDGKDLQITIDMSNGEVRDLYFGGITGNFVSGNPKAYGLNAYIYTGKNAENPRKGRVKGVRMIEEGPVLVSCEVKFDWPGCKDARSLITLVKGLKKLDIVNNIDKLSIRESENVRFAFPFNLPDPQIRMNLAWGDMIPEKDQINGANRNYYTIQHYIDVSSKEGEKGITITSPDAPLWEMGSMGGEAWMDPVPVAARTHPLTYSPNDGWAFHNPSSPLLFSWVMNNSWHTNYKADQEGLTSFRYSIRPHLKFDATAAYRFGVEECQPLVVIQADNAVKFPEPLFTLDDKTTVVVTSIRPGKDHKSLVIRLYNPSDQPGKTGITWRKGFLPDAWLCTAGEDLLEQLPASLDFNAFEVKTVILRQR